MISALTLSIFICIYLYTKHRQSLEQIRSLMVEFEKLSNGEVDVKLNGGSTTLLSKHNSESRSKLLFLSGFKKRSSVANFSNEKLASISYLDCNLNENQLLSEKNQSLLRELNYAKVKLDNFLYFHLLEKKKLKIMF